MQFGIAAKRIGLSGDTIRFYERKALLPRPPRTEEASGSTTIRGIRGEASSLGWKAFRARTSRKQGGR